MTAGQVRLTSERSIITGRRYRVTILSVNRDGNVSVRYPSGYYATLPAAYVSDRYPLVARGR
jgi:hypothetical protein